MLKDLLVPLTETAGDVAAVHAALAIAGAHGARVVLVQFTRLPVPVAGPWGAADLAMGELYATFQARAQDDARAWASRLAEQAPNIPADVRLVESFAVDAPARAAEEARRVDLAILPMVIDVARDGATLRSFFGGLLLESGRPVLLVPTRTAWRAPRKVMLAWQPTREAARAVHDALPLLQGADSVDVVQVGDGDDGVDDDAAHDLAAHLVRHGLQAQVVRLRASHEAIARTLLDHAASIGADLIVAGGYGHSRLREWMMGGVTADLLATAGTIPILFSH